VTAGEWSAIVARVRALCLELPEVEERASHGEPTFFVRGKRAFVAISGNHHGDGVWALTCAAGAGIQSMLVAGSPERFYVPKYVGHRGWLGVRLDRGVDWDELAGIVEEAFAEVAPASLVEQAAARADRGGVRRG
jgi:hypothetical protein